MSYDEDGVVDDEFRMEEEDGDIEMPEGMDIDDGDDDPENRFH